MIYEKLLKEKAIEPIYASEGEIADHLRKARHDIEIAQGVQKIDLDWSFTIAYSGILQAAMAFMYFKGYRPRGEAKHYNTFRFLEASFPKTYTSKINTLQNFRKKRNKTVYQVVGLVSENEAKTIISFSSDFLKEISDLLPNDIIKLSKED